MDVNKNILLGKKIKEIRKSRGLTQDYLAEEVGIDAKHLSRIECGKNSLSLNLLYKICDVLNVEPCVLFDNLALKNKAELIKDINNILEQLSEDQIRNFYRILINMSLG